MRLIWASALGVAVVASAAWGQHGAAGGHAGAGFVRPSAGFSSGRSFSAPSFNSSGGVSAYRPNLTPQQRTSQFSSPTGAAPFGGAYPYGERPSSTYNYGYRPYSRGVYVVPSYLGGFYDYGYPADYSDQQAPQAPAAPQAAEQSDPGYGYAEAPPPPYGAPYPAPARPAYQPEETPSPAADLPPQPELTVLFKDGRQPQQVQNYAVTRTTLYIFDGTRRREIPLDQIDLPLTEKTNREAGVDFEIPAGAGD